MTGTWSAHGALKNMMNWIYDCTHPAEYQLAGPLVHLKQSRLAHRALTNQTPDLSGRSILVKQIASGD